MNPATKTLQRDHIDVFLDEWLPALGRHEVHLVDYAGSYWVLRPELGAAPVQLALGI